MDENPEVGQLKHDLEILRTRYAGYQRLARIVRSIWISFGVILVVGALAAAVKLCTVDAVAGLFCIAALLIFVPAIVWVIGSCGLRWIDVATPRERRISDRIYYSSFFKPGSPIRPFRSEADSVEQQISDLEQRLTELEQS